jgi:transcription initiation factor TFIID TATA-box-binding protein
MRRRRRADVQRGGGTRGLCSLLYYLDVHEAGAEGTRECALVHNVVGTARIAVSPGPLDLRLVNTLVPNSCFVKKKFAAITMRLEDPTCTILLFGSGKCVLTGCRDFISCIRAVYDVLDLLRQNMHGVHFEVENIQLQNIVGHADLELKGAHVDLARFYADHNIECTFQQSMFPGLVYRSSKSNVVLLIFRSGRIVLTGGRDIYCLNEAWNRMLPVVQGYVVSDDVRGSKSTGRASSVFCSGVGGKHEREGEPTCGLVEGDVRAKCSRARRR